jgi:hypothetical protein
MHQQPLQDADEATVKEHASTALRHLSACVVRCRIGDLDPDRRMVARLLPAAHVAIDLRVDQAIGDRRTEQQMVNPQPGIANVEAQFPLYEAGGLFRAPPELSVWVSPWWSHNLPCWRDAFDPVLETPERYTDWERRLRT